MRSILLVFERRAARAAALAVLGTTLVAACNDTQPLGPSRSALPSSPALVRSGSTGSVAWQVVTGKNATLLGGSTFELSNSNSKYIVTDNGNGDADGVAGQITLAAVAPGVYDLCEIKAPAGYAVQQSWKCKAVKVSAGATSNAGIFLNVHLPTVLTGYVDSIRTPIGGGTFTVQDSVGKPVMTIVDNDAVDQDKADGTFSFTLPAMGTFVICETAPPPGYALPAVQSTSCYVQKFTYDTVTQMGPYLVVPTP